MFLSPSILDLGFEADSDRTACNGPGWQSLDPCPAAQGSELGGRQGRAAGLEWRGGG